MIRACACDQGGAAFAFGAGAGERREEAEIDVHGLERRARREVSAGDVGERPGA